MKKFTLAIEESIVQEFGVMASNADEAMAIAIEKYNSGKFVVEHGEIHHKQISIVKPENESSEWVEF